MKDQESVRNYHLIIHKRLKRVKLNHSIVKLVSAQANVPSVTSYQPPKTQSIYREGMAVDGLGDQIENIDYNEFLTLFKDSIKSVQTDSRKLEIVRDFWEETCFNS